MGLQILNSRSTLRLVVQFWKGNIEWISIFLQLLVTFIQSYHEGIKTRKPPRFYMDVWLCFTVQNWVLDVSRPDITLILPSDRFPLNCPSAAEYLHVLYAPFAAQGSTLPHVTSGQHVSLSVVMATTLHLAAELVRRRLLMIGYQLHQSLTHSFSTDLKCCLKAETVVR
uniref:Uncharacterized protein n=1 Tax=Takifugu rubripes TaxID=31033 RepID=A0A674MD77_TAKRU